MTAAEDFEDPEEAAAWAEIRAAFAEDEPDTSGSAPAGSSPSASSKGNRLAKDKPQGKGGGSTKAKPASSTKASAASTKTSADSTKTPATSNKGDATPAPGKPAVASAADDWLQSEVDRLVGEVQRLTDEPFTAELLRAVWSLSLEDQQEMLLGATASYGSPLESPAEKAARIWRLVTDEVRARGGKIQVVKRNVTPAPAAAPAQRAPATAPLTQKGMRTKPAAAPRTAGAPRMRSRSRSPSI
eukprot:TRINITY_DN29112_c0_g2_i1.p1 TRINITY_DN29112_c0_g2~~TRINITY_DN29112_c0_g2_i1.p1  ORF type:complete len:243 (+),score=55.85 TRINITY_DN29112_c0_g2_i1:86-814(+)